MINFLNLKHTILAWLAGAAALLLAIFKIRQGGKDAQRAENNQATLDNIKAAQQVIHTTSNMSDAERLRGRKKWTRK